jgi:ABC-type glycerol-3-phosphate transport system substrate-binding protein
MGLFEFKIKTFSKNGKGNAPFPLENGYFYYSPIRLSIAYSSEFAEVLPERGIHNTVHLMPYYETMLVFNHWGETWTAINRALESVWIGDTPAAEALKGAQKEIDSLMGE